MLHQVIGPFMLSYAFFSVVIYPGKACKRDCIKGNGTSNQQDSCHCRDFKGYISLKDVLVVPLEYTFKCMQMTVWLMFLVRVEHAKIANIPKIIGSKNEKVT